MYQFLLNMWIVRKVNEKYLENQVLKGRISEEQKDFIVTQTRIEE